VLLAAKNDAIFMRDGQEVKIPAGTLYDSVESFDVDGVGKFDGYGNRNSLNYVSIYRIPETKEIIRGTFRYNGWCATLRKLIDVGYLSENEHVGLPGKTYAKLTAELIGSPDSTDVRGATAARLHLGADSDIMKALDFIGVFSDDLVASAKSPIDALVATMLPKMQYKSGEQDMIFMQHKLRVEYPAEKKVETIISRMVSYGDDKIGSAMSRTVSYPVAIATRLLLDGVVKLEPGLVIPSIPELYNPILEELGSKFGITWNESYSTEAL
jgi:saccharopine dehydrogenase (NADP+, L-glutamate forming)